MPLGNFKMALYQELEELFATAAVDELTGDTDMYKAKLDMLAQIAELLGMETEITTHTLNLKAHDLV
ncbi:MAG: hypothetical protein FWB96_11465 [Defluviitaleaceae bacterium]|nr:hypothetical protein [Defluviitaleaceae bacterium]MCL2263681.1 hypothetical protein [Defluviitaleaceae bacterium]